MVVLGLRAKVPMFKEHHNKSSKEKVSQLQWKVEQPKNFVKKGIQEGDGQGLEKPKTRLVRIRVSDPYATESSSDEGEQEKEALGKRRGELIYVAKIPWDITHCSSLSKNHHKQEKEFFHEKEKIKTRTRCENSKGHKKKHDNSSSPSSTPLEGLDGGQKGLLKPIAWPALGLPDVPGPIPNDLESLVLDASVLANFFGEVPDD